MSAVPTMDEAYRKATAAGLAFLVCLEVMYFVLSPAPSFWIPSMDAIGQTAIGRDFLNIWMGGRAALSDGPAVFFDYWAYNVYLQAFFGTGDLHHYFWSYPPHILLFIWPFGLMPYLAAFALWSLLGIMLFMFAVSAGGVERKNLLFIAVAPAVAVNLFIGQNGCFFAALLIGGLEKVGLDSNFFALGGHSLLAMQSLSQVRHRLPILLSLSDFFANPTIAQLASVIQSRLLRSHSSDGEASAATWRKGARWPASRANTCCSYRTCSCCYGGSSTTAG